MTLLYSNLYGEIPLTPHFKDIGRDIIPGADALYYKGHIGEILIQQQITASFIFHYAHYYFNSRSIISFRHQGFALQSLIPLNQDINTHITGADNFLLRKEHLVLTHNPAREMSFIFEKGKNYFAFGSSFNLDFVYKHLQQFFNQTEIAKFYGPNFFALTGTPKFASHKIIDVINDIIGFSVPSPIRGNYNAIKMEEFFVLQLARIFSKPEPKLKLSERQLEGLEQVRHILLEDFTKRHTPRELCKRTHITMHTLKNGFKAVYGLAPYEYQKDARLRKAKDLLTHTDKPIKEIAALVNYASFASFVDAFTNHFGYTPGYVRK